MSVIMIPYITLSLNVDMGHIIQLFQKGFVGLWTALQGIEIGHL